MRFAGQVASPLDPLPGCAFAPRCALALPECSTAMPPLAEVAAGQRSRCIRWACFERVPDGNDSCERADARGARPQEVLRPRATARCAPSTTSASRSRRARCSGLVGESGSGKSTIGRSVLKLIEPTAGEVRFEGVDLAPLVGARDAALPPPPADHLPGPVREPEPAPARRRHARPRRWRRTACTREPARAKRIAELLSLVGLAPEHAQRFPHEFSGGQRQRIGIARALAVEPRFIVADEPVSALDVSIQAQVINLLSRPARALRPHDAVHLARSRRRRIPVRSHRRALSRQGDGSRAGEDAVPDAAASLHRRRCSTRRRGPIRRRGAARRLLQGDIPSPVDPPSGCVFRTRCPYAIDACAATVPPLREVAPGRFKACIRDDISLNDGATP